MTTTKLFEGLDGDARNSSRVLRPPGGGSSNIFGSGDAGGEQRNVKNYNKSDIFGTGPAEVTTGHGRRTYKPTGAAASPFATEENILPPKQQTPAKAVPTNPIAHVTAEENKSKPAPKPEAETPTTGTAPAPAASVQTFTRVRQPPGGASSGPLW